MQRDRREIANSFLAAKVCRGRLIRKRSHRNSFKKSFKKPKRLVRIEECQDQLLNFQSSEWTEWTEWTDRNCLRRLSTSNWIIWPCGCVEGWMEFWWMPFTIFCVSFLTIIRSPVVWLTLGIHIEAHMKDPRWDPRWDSLWDSHNWRIVKVTFTGAICLLSLAFDLAS